LYEAGYRSPVQSRRQPVRRITLPGSLSATKRIQQQAEAYGTNSPHSVESQPVREVGIVCMCGGVLRTSMRGGVLQGCGANCCFFVMMVALMGHWELLLMWRVERVISRFLLPG